MIIHRFGMFMQHMGFVYSVSRKLATGQEPVLTG